MYFLYDEKNNFMPLFVFLILEHLIRQICLVGAIDKTGPAK